MYVRSVFSFRPVVSVRSRRFYKEDSTKRLLEFLADMPKANSGRIAETQRQRQQISKKSEKYGPSTVYLQVLGSGTRGAPNTLYLSTDHKRYLFNCGESTQRLAHEHKVRLSKLEHIFITSKSWRNIGGLPGLSLTLQDVGVPNITLHGPEGLDTLYNATKRFVIMKDMQVTMAKSSPSEEFEDGIMNVKYVLLRDPYEELLVSESIKPGAKKVKDPLKKEYERFFNDDTDYYKKEAQETPGSPRGRSAEKKKNERVVNKPKSPDPYKKKAEKALLALEKSSKSCTVAYICTLKKRLGTLDLEKCVEFGVKPGPLLGQLKAGLDVVLPDGKIVHSADVKTPDEPGPVFIVLEVPDISYLKEAEFANYFDDGINPLENIPTVVVHFTPPHVFHEAQYQAFVQRFGPTTRHLVVNEQNSCLGSEAVHRTQHKLHLLDPDIFPLLKDVSVPAVWTATLPMPKANSPVRLKGMEELKNKFQNIINMEGSCKGDYRPPNSGIEDSDATKIELINARTLTTFHLRPRKHLDRSLEPKLHIQDYIQETMDVDGFVSSLEQFRHLVDGMRYARTANANEYPKVVFLGTGSCIPSKTRNTSSIVVHVNEESSMLLDCGEGTFSQLVRFYGPKRVNAMLRTIKAIYVSHLHADHHIGLIGVLQARRQAFEETNTLYVPAWLFAPGQIVAWLSMYDDQFEPIRQDFSLVPNQNLLTDSQPSSPKDSSSLMTPATLASIGLSALRTCFVSHCPNAFGVCLDIDQHRITYSGDTIPCESLVNLGQGSTLLIHEATMEDELAEEARYKMHSTTTQAIEQGRLMSAKYTVLTHFSQRYARLPRLNANILSGNHSVGIAFDNMQITMNDLELLPHMYPPLQLMFAEHCVEMELRAAHRANKERFAGTKRKHSNSDGVATKIDKTDRPETKTDGERDKTAENVGPETQDGTPQSNLEISNMDVVRTETEIRQKIKRAGSGLTSRDRSVSRSRPPSFRSNLPLRVAGARQRDASRQDVRSVSGSSTPRSISVSRSPPPKRFTRHSNPSSGTCTPKQRCETPERHRDCANPPNTTPSEVSTDISKKRAATPEKPNKAKIHVVDSRSRTFRTHSTDRSSTEEDTKKPAKRINPTPNNYHPPMHSPTTKTVYRAENISHGYGKPIIPMQNRRLSIMKQSHIPVVDDKSTNSSNISNKTIGSNAENRGSNKSSPVHTRNNSRIEVLKHKSQHETSLSKLKQSFLANVVLYAIFWRMSCAVSWFWQERYRWLTPIIAVGVLFWTVTKSISKMAAKSPPMTPPVYGKDRQKSPSSPASPPKSRSGTDTQSYTKIKGRDQKPLGSPVSVSELRHSITKPSTPRVPDRTRNTPVETPDTRPPFKHHIVNDYKQEPKIPCTKRESECPKNCPSNHREATNEILRQQSSKEVKDMRPSPLTSRPTSAASRSFKPQLEDIKSSLLLLKKSGSKTKVLSPPNSVNKPRPLNESERREMLEEARRKFQSRGFFHDAKYDKIEGLNWISWKA